MAGRLLSDIGRTFGRHGQTLEESHEENRVNFADVDFYARNTLNEKVKTAQYILCLMYALNPKRVEMRLKNITDDGKKSIEKIKEWYANISE